MFQVVLHNRHWQIVFHLLKLFLRESLEIYNFLFIEVLLTKLWVPKMRSSQPHTSLFWDFYYIIHSYPSETMVRMA